MAEESHLAKFLKSSGQEEKKEILPSQKLKKEPKKIKKKIPK